MRATIFGSLFHTLAVSLSALANDLQKKPLPLPQKWCNAGRIMDFQFAEVALNHQRIIVVPVRDQILSWPTDAEIVRDRMQKHFGGAPIVLASPDSVGSWEYQGEEEFVEYVKGIHPAQYRWQEGSLPY